MAKNTLKTVQNQQPQWTSDTTDYFSLQLEGACSILVALVANIGEYEKDDGRATDEALVLAMQYVMSVTSELEKLSYELGDIDGLGDLSLQLMWARALLEIVEGMSSVGGWKIRLGDVVLAGYLGAVERILCKANGEAQQIHVRKFSAAPAIAAMGAQA